MISLNMHTVHICGSLTGQGPQHGVYEPEGLRPWLMRKERMRLERTCSTGSKDGADTCVQSKWGDENNVNHEELEREIDSQIEDLFSKALATGLQIIQEHYDQIQSEMRFCIVT
jgi:hypothetical protein